MFTYCPDCSSIYEISAEQLGAAGGLVRCGNCNATFSALRRLTETPPDFATETGTSTEASADRATREAAAASAADPATDATQGIEDTAMPAATNDDGQRAETDTTDDTAGQRETDDLPLPVEPLEDWDTDEGEQDLELLLADEALLDQNEPIEEDGDKAAPGSDRTAQVQGSRDSDRESLHRDETNAQVLTDDAGSHDSDTADDDDEEAVDTKTPAISDETVVDAHKDSDVSSNPDREDAGDAPHNTDATRNDTDSRDADETDAAQDAGDHTQSGDVEDTDSALDAEDDSETADADDKNATHDTDDETNTGDDDTDTMHDTDDDTETADADDTDTAHDTDEDTQSGDVDDTDAAHDAHDDTETADADDTDTAHDTDDDTKTADADDTDATHDTDEDTQSGDEDDTDAAQDADDDTETADADDTDTAHDTDDDTETADADDVDTAHDTDDDTETADADDTDTAHDTETADADVTDTVHDTDDDTETADADETETAHDTDDDTETADADDTDTAHDTDDDTETADADDTDTAHDTDDDTETTDDILIAGVDGTFDTQLDEKRDYKDLSRYLNPDKSMARRAGEAAILLLLVAVLGVQFVHHNRTVFATHPQIGQYLQSTYKTLGLALNITQNADDYRVARHTIVPDANNLNTLMARATIVNNSPQPRPVPLVRLEIRNRWGDAIFARIFSADEYVTGAVPAVIPGNGRLEVALDIVNPTDAIDIGYSFDICVTGQDGRPNCDKTGVFE